MNRHTNHNQAPTSEKAHELVQIQNGNVLATINPQGAYVQQFAVIDSAGERHDILFPKSTIDGKPRATHLCLPNFGPDATGELAQHGFARDVTWEIIGQSTEELKMQYRHTQGSYAGLTAELHLRVNPHEQPEDEADEIHKNLGGGALVLDLMLLNEGGHFMRVAPAVHNYFALPKDVSAETVVVHNKTYNREDLEAATTELWPTDSNELLQPVTVEFPRHTVVMHSNNFNHYTAWTNHAGPYICVEPSAAGPSFLNEQAGKDEHLEVNKAKLYRMVIETVLKQA